MSKSIKIVVFCLVISGLCSCARVEQNIAWLQDVRYISAEGGTCVCTPHKDSRIFPNIIDMYVAFENCDGERVDFIRIDLDSEKIKKPRYEKIEGEWYEVVASLNNLSITLSPNESLYQREVCVTFDGGNTGFDGLSVTQPPKSWE